VAEWNLAVGETLSRDDRVARFGGGRQGGIEPSARSANIFVYSDPEEGHRHGYIFDGWVPDRSTFLYTGEGRHGPQQMTDGNLALARHKQDGRALRLFVADGFIPGRSAKQQRYVGRFEVADDPPYLEEEAPDLDGLDRSVFVFRLTPIGEALVDLEAGNNLTSMIGPGKPTVAIRREWELSEAFRASLGDSANSIRRWKIRPAGALRPLYTDMYDPDRRELYEVKASNSREAVRSALGQLLDYREWIDPSPRACTIVLPGPPPPGMDRVLHTLAIGLVYRNTRTGAFVRVD
jgi:hypothetical protein